jgi:hypothetical protein
MRTLAAVLTLAAAAPAALAAQGDCFPPKDSNEARTFGVFAVPLAFSPAGAPAPAGRLHAGLEVVWLPDIDDATATPTVCRPGKGPENTDLLPAAVRPRLLLSLGGGLTAEASWVPPLRVNQVRANLFGVALAWTAGLGRDHALTLRGHGTFGRIRAPITCPDRALADPGSECFQGQRSDDSYRPNAAGVEGIVSWSLGGGRVRPYLGAGYNRLMPRFQVNFTNAQGSLDNRRVEVDLDRAVLFAGATWAAAPGLGLSAELYGAPADALTGRVAVRVGPTR